MLLKVYCRYESCRPCTLINIFCLLRFQCQDHEYVHYWVLVGTVWGTWADTPSPSALSHLLTTPPCTPPLWEPDNCAWMWNLIIYSIILFYFRLIFGAKPTASKHLQRVAPHGFIRLSIHNSGDKGTAELTLHFIPTCNLIRAARQNTNKED